MALHVRSCPACSTQKSAEETLQAYLAPGFPAPEDAAACERVTERWRGILTQPVGPATRGETLPPSGAKDARRGTRGIWGPARRRLVAATVVLGTVLCLLAGSALYAPQKAMAEVADAMRRVQRFHLRMEVPGTEVHYEAWGERSVGARAEEWDGKRLSTVILDDGRLLRGFYLEEHVVRQGKTRLGEFFREAAGFNASKMLSQAASGKLFEKAEWLGEPTAREVARVERGASAQRRIEVDLKGGFFERMVIYADLASDRLLEANLYTDRRSPESAAFARITFDYPEQIDRSRFTMPPHSGPALEFRERDLQAP